MIGWLPSNIRPRIEEKVLNTLEKKILYEGTVTGQYNSTDCPKNTKIYKTGDINTIFEGLALGYYIAQSIPTHPLYGDILAYTAGAILGIGNILARYVVNADEKSSYIKTTSGKIKRHIPVAGNLFTALPISVAVKAYDKIKLYLNAKKEQLEKKHNTEK